ncbi:MAG: cation diffusion facilitator family transporter [Polyangiaceae bacterium]|nr:cation diffusion facilitator family transporter [Polyangiaceae bacterium]
MSASGGGDSRKVIIAALAGNLAIAACKFVAAFLSGSASTLAEAVHSLADSGNQGLLLLGLRLSQKDNRDKFAFGRSAEKYFWPFVVSLILFSVGGAFAIWEGVSHLLHPNHDPPRVFNVAGHAISSNVLNYVVLGTSFAFESLSFRVAWGEFKAMSKGRSVFEVFREARDPTIPLVLAEDATALVGLGIALLAVVLSSVTGRPYFDALGSMIIGILLCVVAMLLARSTHALLIGKAATVADQAEVLALTDQIEEIEKVTQLLTMHLGPDFVILALKVAYRPTISLAEIEEATDRLEDILRKELPQMKKIFIEPDSKGDGRGLTAARAYLEKHGPPRKEHVDSGSP